MTRFAAVIHGTASVRSGQTTSPAASRAGRMAGCTRQQLTGDGMSPPGRGYNLCNGNTQGRGIRENGGNSSGGRITLTERATGLSFDGCEKSTTPVLNAADGKFLPSSAEYRLDGTTSMAGRKDEVMSEILARLKDGELLIRDDAGQCQVYSHYDNIADLKGELVDAREHLEEYHTDMVQLRERNAELEAQLAATKDATRDKLRGWLSDAEKRNAELLEALKKSRVYVSMRHRQLWGCEALDSTSSPAAMAVAHELEEIDAAIRRAEQSKETK